MYPNNQNQFNNQPYINNNQETIEVLDETPITTQVQNNDIKATIILKIITDIIKKPVTLIKEMKDKCSDSKSTLKLVLTITVFAIVLGMASGLITGGFNSKYDFTTGRIISEYNFSNIFSHNFLINIAISIIFSTIIILINSGIYYIMAKLKKQSNINFYQIIGITSICFIPLIIGINALFPIISIINIYLGIIVLFISIFHTIAYLIIGFNSVTEFNKESDLIYYHLVAIGITFSIIFIIGVIILHNNISAISYGISIAT